MDAAGVRDVGIVTAAGEIAGLAGGELFRILKTAAGDDPARKRAPQPQTSATSGKIAKSLRAWPGARETFSAPARRGSLVMKMPSFLPQPAAGRTRSASWAVSVVADMSCTTRKSSFARSVRSRDWLIHECAVLMAMTQRSRIAPRSMASRIWSYA